jgi:nitroimidazol reductase NimA-like FMN-containing flavoprotein (pyridoxamine 5'-phosphate oxidase superfamily)
MSYVTDDDCREFYMLTLPATKKYRNLEGNSAVSLLIDTREEDVDHRRKDIRALTVSGVFRKIDDDTTVDAIIRKLLQKHPHLEDFAKSSGIKVFAVRAKSFQLLEGVSRAHFEEVE